MCSAEEKAKKILPFPRNSFAGHRVPQRPPRSLRHGRWRRQGGHTPANVQHANLHSHSSAHDPPPNTTHTQCHASPWECCACAAHHVHLPCLTMACSAAPAEHLHSRFGTHAFPHPHTPHTPHNAGSRHARNANAACFHTAHATCTTRPESEPAGCARASTSAVGVCGDPLVSNRKRPLAPRTPFVRLLGASAYLSLLLFRARE